MKKKQKRCELRNLARDVLRKSLVGRFVEIAKKFEERIMLEVIFYLFL